MIESSVAETWLYSQLAGDGEMAVYVGQRVFGHLAPQTASYPYALFTLQASSDENALQGRAVTRLMYQVKIIGVGGSMGAIAAAANRLDALLQDAQTVVNGTRLRCQREQVVAYPEIANGVAYYHLGGLYRVWAG